jgi:hypothetical protein
MSMISVRTTALDVCEFVYGDNVAPFNTVARFYETNASQCFQSCISFRILTVSLFKCKLIPEVLYYILTGWFKL